MRILKEESVALVVDFQERLVPVMDEANQLIKNAKILIEGLEVLKVPVLTTQQYSKGLGMTVDAITSAIQQFEPIEKTSFSCYDVDQVKQYCTENNIKNVIISGIEAHVCVLQTAVDMKEAGLNPVVVADCISSRSSKNVEIALDRFRHEGIMLTSYESILFELTRGAKQEGFREISKLVK